MSTRHRVPRVRKRLIVCCDGTWQSSVSGERNIPSNVTRLCRHIEKSDVFDEKTGQIWRQIVFYDPGIGTGDLSIWDTVLQGGTGLGLERNVFEAYNFLALNYQPPDPMDPDNTGDRIYCFGFSRGAYTARALSGFITKFGICSPLDMQALTYIYNLYEKYTPWSKGESHKAHVSREALYGKGWKEGEEPKKDSPAYNWLHGKPVDIILGDPKLGAKVKYKMVLRKPIDLRSRDVEVVGVWETVGSLGIPKVFGLIKPKLLSLFTNFDAPGREFHDVSLSSRVKWAFHALALDEERSAFIPTLWYVPHGKHRKHETLKQVWFPGAHINVGGGSDDVLEGMVSDFEGIANITFAWMIEQLRPHLKFNQASFVASIADQAALLESLKEHPLPWPQSPFFKLLAAPRRIWRFVTNTAAKVQIPVPGWASGRIDKWPNGSFVMYFGGRTIRRPGEMKAPINKGAKSTYKPLDGEKGLGRTYEMIDGEKCLGRIYEMVHPCVWTRIQTTKFCPPALEGFTRERAESSSNSSTTATFTEKHAHSSKHSHATKQFHPSEHYHPHSGWVWRKSGAHDDVLLPEYQVSQENMSSSDKTERNLERLIVKASGKPATEYLEMLDDVLYENGEDRTDKVTMKGTKIGIYGPEN